MQGVLWVNVFSLLNVSIIQPSVDVCIVRCWLNGHLPALGTRVFALYYVVLALVLWDDNCCLPVLPEWWRGTPVYPFHLDDYRAFLKLASVRLYIAIGCSVLFDDFLVAVCYFILLLVAACYLMCLLVAVCYFMSLLIDVLFDVFIGRSVLFHVSVGRSVSISWVYLSLCIISWAVGRTVLSHVAVCCSVI